MFINKYHQLCIYSKSINWHTEKVEQKIQTRNSHFCFAGLAIFFFHYFGHLFVYIDRIVRKINPRSFINLFKAGNV